MAWQLQFSSMVSTIREIRWPSTPLFQHRSLYFLFLFCENKSIQRIKPQKENKNIMQEASSGVHEIFFSQFLVGFVQVVFQWKRAMWWWIPTVPYIWIESVEANVCIYSLLCFFKERFRTWLHSLSLISIKYFVY